MHIEQQIMAQLGCATEKARDDIGKKCAQLGAKCQIITQCFNMLLG